MQMAISKCPNTILSVTLLYVRINCAIWISMWIFMRKTSLGLLSSLSSTEIRGPDLPRYEHYVLLLLIISVCWIHHYKMWTKCTVQTNVDTAAQGLFNIHWWVKWVMCRWNIYKWYLIGSSLGVQWEVHRRKVMEGHGRFFPHTRLTFHVRKV